MYDILFKSLRAVSGDVVLGHNEQAEGNAQVMSFVALESVGGSLVVYDVPGDGVVRSHKVNSLYLPVLKEIGGDFNVSDVDGLAYFDVLALTDVAGGLNVVNNVALKNLTFPELRRVNHVNIQRSDNRRYGVLEEISFPEMATRLRPRLPRVRNLAQERRDWTRLSARHYSY